MFKYIYAAGSRDLKGIRKVRQKVVALHNGFMTLLCNYYCDKGYSIDEISVSLECCIIGLWFPVKTNYVFKH